MDPSLFSVEENVVRLTFLGGLGEIGSNCLALETSEDMIVIDCGLLFTDLENFGVDFAIPNFKYLLERKEKLRAFVFTHGHEDHIGALPFAIKSGLEAPIYASPFTSLMIRERTHEYGFAKKVEVHTFMPGQDFSIGDFSLTPVSVNHSIVEAVAFIIDTPIGKIVHTGDFRFDDSPVFGNKLDIKAFQKAGEQGVLLMLSDSTNVETETANASEKTVENGLDKAFASAQGMMVATLFSSNVGRVSQMFKLAKKFGRKVALTGRSLEQNVRLALESGYLKDLESQLISLDDLDQFSKKELLVLTTGCQGEYRSALNRVAIGEHKQITLEPDDHVIFSSKFIPGNEKAIYRVINSLFKYSSNILYEAVDHIHVSGHATRPELEKMIKTVKPEFFIPVHGEYRHLKLHAKLAIDTGVEPKKVKIVENGTSIDLSKNDCKVIASFEETRILVEGHQQNDINRDILRERRRLGERGVAFALVLREPDHGTIVSGPEIILRGVVKEELEAMLIKGSVKQVKAVLRKYEKDLKKGPVNYDLGEIIRIELRKYIKEHTGCKTIVVPVVLDVGD